MQGLRFTFGGFFPGTPDTLALLLTVTVGEVALGRGVAFGVTSRGVVKGPHA